MARRKVTTAPVLASWAETDKALRVVGYRLSSKLVLPKGRVEDVIAQLKALGRDNLIKRTETLDREALRREPAELLCKLGAYINQTDEFYYDVSEAEAKEL